MFSDFNTTEIWDALKTGGVFKLPRAWTDIESFHRRSAFASAGAQECYHQSRLEDPVKGSVYSTLAEHTRKQTVTGLWLRPSEDMFCPALTQWPGGDRPVSLLSFAMRRGGFPCQLD